MVDIKVWIQYVSHYPYFKLIQTSPTWNTDIFPYSSPTLKWVPFCDHIRLFNNGELSRTVLAVGDSVLLLRFHKSKRPVTSIAANTDGCTGDQATLLT